MCFTRHSFLPLESYFSRLESYVASACVDRIVTARVSENHVRTLMLLARWCVDCKKSFLKGQPLDEVYKCFTLFYFELCELYCTDMLANYEDIALKKLMKLPF